LDTPVEDRLHVIDGVVPNLLRLPPGCAFAPRCPRAMEVCRVKVPTLNEVEPDRKVSCWLYASPNQEAVS